MKMINACWRPLLSVSKDRSDWKRIAGLEAAVAVRASSFKGGTARCHTLLSKTQNELTQRDPRFFAHSVQEYFQKFEISYASSLSSSSSVSSSFLVLILIINLVLLYDA